MNTPAPPTIPARSGSLPQLVTARSSRRCPRRRPPTGHSRSSSIRPSRGTAGSRSLSRRSARCCRSRACSARAGTRWSSRACSSRNWFSTPPVGRGARAETARRCRRSPGRHVDLPVPLHGLSGGGAAQAGRSARDVGHFHRATRTDANRPAQDPGWRVVGRDLGEQEEERHRGGGHSAGHGRRHRRDHPDRPVCSVRRPATSPGKPPTSRPDS